MVSRSSPDMRRREGERYWVWVRVVPRGVVTVETMVRSSARAAAAGRRQRGHDDRGVKRPHPFRL